MSTVMTNSVRRVSDHFEPEPALDPQEQRKLRGHLEQIDYAAYAANQEIVSHVLQGADQEKFQRLAVAAAHARAKWVARAVALSEGTQALAPAQVSELETLRAAFEELSQAYEALRRMVERGYLPYRGR